MKARRDLCSLLSPSPPFTEAGQLKQVAQGHVQPHSDCLQGRERSLPPLSTCSHLWQVPHAGEPRTRASTPDVSQQVAKERRWPPFTSWLDFSSDSPTCYLRPSLAFFVTRAYWWLTLLLLSIRNPNSCFPAGQPQAHIGTWSYFSSGTGPGISLCSTSQDSLLHISPALWMNSSTNL